MQNPNPSPHQDTGPGKRTHHDVFISYAQLDKPIADAICALLESRRIRCWIAPRDVPPAREFPAAIIEGIEESQSLVLVFSSHANNSPHVIRELTNAVNKGRIIIPFRVEDVLPSKSMEYLISVPHWLDAITPPLEKHIDELANTIEHLLENTREPVLCTVCGMALSPQAKFCKSCGSLVQLEKPAPAQQETDKYPYQPVPPPAETAPPAPPVPAAGVTTPAPFTRKKKILAGAVIACLAIVALGLLLPMISPGMYNPLAVNSGNKAVEQMPVTTPPVDYRSEAAPINLVTLTVEPTQQLPEEIGVTVEASKDPSSAVITVQFNGGPGGDVVQDNTVTLTRSDGTVETGKLNFKERLSEINLQGTRGTDRLQVVVVMGTGTPYTIIDQLMPFRARNIR